MSVAVRERGRSAIRGVGLGLRAEHEPAWLGGAAAGVPFAEVLADDFLASFGPARRRLLALRETHPVVLHGVGMSLGSTDEPDRVYLARLAELARELEPAWISEHLAWTSVGGRHHHELLPLPFVEESVEVLARNVRIAQDVLGVRLLVENSVRYLGFALPELGEAEFVRAVLEAADCDLLLDVSNLFLDARNHGFDPLRFLAALPPERVRQMHLGGYDEGGPLWVDAHASAVADPVWALFEAAQARFPGTPTSIEWDRELPPFETLLGERARAAAIADRVAAEWTHAA